MRWFYSIEPIACMSPERDHISISIRLANDGNILTRRTRSTTDSSCEPSSILMLSKAAILTLSSAELQRSKHNFRYALIAFRLVMTYGINLELSVMANLCIAGSESSDVKWMALRK